ncbi:MAG: TonB-dependent receptor [Cytophagaceae bacterium]|nr:TonB-dependent receptor [Cytophagaceae bacterium]
MKKIGILCLGLFTFFSAAAQRTFTISGKIREAGTGEALIGASVYVSALKRGAVSNQYGFFSLALPPGQHEVVASFVGFGAEKLSLTLQKDTTLALELRPTTLQEVIVRDNAPMRRDVGFLNIPVQRLKQIPMLLGEPDLLKALAMTPGVVVGQEGSSGLYVRGSSPEQNLILLDEAPVYNPSHVFGFLSTL